MAVGGAPDVVPRVIVGQADIYAETEMQGVELARPHRDPVFADVLDRRGDAVQHGPGGAAVVG